MTSALIGHTGFVGGNLKTQHHFTDFYNSKNISEIEGKTYDLVVCSGIPASMWLANTNPELDLKNIKSLLRLLFSVNCEQFVLISSTSVLAHPVKSVNEDTSKFEDTLAYGKHRRHAEAELQKHFDNCLIVRIPALFGEGLKKNLIYDLLNQEPAFMPTEKFKNILNKLSKPDAEIIKMYYDLDEENGRYVFNKFKATENNARDKVLSIFKTIEFTALKFTHSESVFQFYDLSHIWEDINRAIKHNIEVLHLCSEPISASDVAKEVFQLSFQNNTGKPPFDYDMHTKYSGLWGKDIPYQYSRAETISKLKAFANRNS